MKKLISALLTVSITFSGLGALASGAIPDHMGTSMAGIEVGTAKMSDRVRQYYDLFQAAGDRYGVDPNLLAAICMQESSGINYSYRDDGTEYPAWGIMQIEYSMVEDFVRFGLETTGEKWTTADRLDPEKAIPYAAWLISRALLHYDCDYMKTIQSYNFGQIVTDRIIDAKGDDWLSERANAAKYASNWSYDKYGDAEYIEHVMRYYTGEIEYIGAKVRMGGELIDFGDQYPLIEDGYTYIPIRAVSEALGAEVDWDEKTQCAVINYEKSEIVLPIGSEFAYIDGKTVETEAAARIINDRTMVPLRFVAQSLGLEVTWDEDTRTVYIK